MTYSVSIALGVVWLLAQGSGVAVADGYGGRLVSAWVKLERIVIDEIELEGASLAEAVDLVREKAREADRLEGEPEARGMRIGFERRRGGEPERLVSLKMEGATLGEVLEEMGVQTQRVVQIFPDGVVLM